MDRSKVRIGLISIGIIAGLTLILYLPVLIWSPPWGEDGYYYKGQDTNMFYFSHDDGKVTFGNIINANFAYEEDMAKGNIWLTKYFMNNGRLAVYQYVIEPHVQVFLTSVNGIQGTINMQKTFNPFIMWYIKWLEWTAE